MKKIILLIAMVALIATSQAQLMSSENIQLTMETETGFEVEICNKPLMFVMGDVSTNFQNPAIRITFAVFDIQQLKFVRKNVTLSVQQNREVIELLAQMAKPELEKLYNMEFTIDESFINQMTTNTLNQ